jgi:hypothetical protein
MDQIPANNTIVLFSWGQSSFAGTFAVESVPKTSNQNKAITSRKTTDSMTHCLLDAAVFPAGKRGCRSLTTCCLNVCKIHPTVTLSRPVIHILPSFSDPELAPVRGIVAHAPLRCSVLIRLEFGLAVGLDLLWWCTCYAKAYQPHPGQAYTSAGAAGRGFFSSPAFSLSTLRSCSHHCARA